MRTQEIRPLRAEDLPAVRAIIDGVGLFPADLLDDMAAPFLAAAEPAEIWCVLLEDALPAAVAYCAPERMTEGTWNLLLIAVRADRQGRGLGARLTKHIERTLTSRCARILLVETSGLPEFSRTRAVYRRLGYAEAARIPEFYAAGEDKLVFVKRLPAAA